MPVVHPPRDAKETARRLLPGLQVGGGGGGGIPPSYFCPCAAAVRRRRTSASPRCTSPPPRRTSPVPPSAAPTVANLAGGGLECRLSAISARLTAHAPSACSYHLPACLPAFLPHSLAHSLRGPVHVPSFPASCVCCFVPRRSSGSSARPHCAAASGVAVVPHAALCDAASCATSPSPQTFRPPALRPGPVQPTVLRFCH